MITEFIDKLFVTKKYHSSHSLGGGLINLCIKKYILKEKKKKCAMKLDFTLLGDFMYVSSDE